MTAPASPILIDGLAVSKIVRETVRARVATLSVQPALAVILVGERKGQRNVCEYED